MKLTVGIALLGCGTVGAEVADRLVREQDAIERASGAQYELRGIAIRDAVKERPDSIEDRRLFTGNARSLVDDPHVDLVVELIGGIDEAASLVERALERGRHVVTANKDVIGTQGPRLRALAASRAVTLRFDAAVAGAIPLLRTLDEALAGDEVRSVAGVLNGTCGFILDAMERGAAFDEALACAQELGYAEADPSNDVEGADAAYKLAAIAQVGFGVAVISPRIRRSGIASVTSRHVAQARELGLRLRLVAATARTSTGITAEVAPVLVSEEHEFARAAGAENVAHVEARDAGRLSLRGSGAGGRATASAVLGDVVAVLRAIGQRRDFSDRAGLGLAPALDVTPFFSKHARVRELPQYPLWNDGAMPFAQRSLASA
jgi:homoserine dehydrogenase